MLGPAPNAEFTDHWATRDGDLVPTFTVRMMATRELSANEQILIDYGSDFAALEPYQDHVVGGNDEEKDKASEQQPKAARVGAKRKLPSCSSGTVPNTP